MAMRLLQLRVPVKHLVYGGTAIRHNDFVFDWKPLTLPQASAPSPASAQLPPSSKPAAAGAAVAAVNNGQPLQQQAAAAERGAAGGGVRGQSGEPREGGGEGADRALEGLPSFARDLLLVLLGRVHVRFLTGLPPASKL